MVWMCVEGVGKEPPLPSPDILRAIRSLAPFVARMGPAFEALALQKNSGHPDFRFLYGGEGREYYRWQVRWPAEHRHVLYVVRLEEIVEDQVWSAHPGAASLSFY
jgi:hypothetical protein